jgi:hypothetical protein
VGRERVHPDPLARGVGVRGARIFLYQLQLIPKPAPLRRRLVSFPGDLPAHSQARKDPVAQPDRGRQRGGFREAVRVQAVGARRSKSSGPPSGILLRNQRNRSKTGAVFRSRGRRAPRFFPRKRARDDVLLVLHHALAGAVLARDPRGEPGALRSTPQVRHHLARGPARPQERSSGVARPGDHGRSGPGRSEHARLPGDAHLRERGPDRACRESVASAPRRGGGGRAHPAVHLGARGAGRSPALPRRGFIQQP